MSNTTPAPIGYGRVAANLIEAAGGMTPDNVVAFTARQGVRSISTTGYGLVALELIERNKPAYRIAVAA